MSELVAVLGDEESHGNGQLLCDNNTGKFFIQGIKVAYHGSSAEADDAPHSPPLTNADTTSQRVFSEGLGVHRNNDLRYCGAQTIVTHQNKVYAG